MTNHFSQRLRIDEFSIVGDRERTMRCVNDEGLTIDFFAGCTGAVPRVTDSKVAL